jgi:hypothetical protein
MQAVWAIAVSSLMLVGLSGCVGGSSERGEAQSAPIPAAQPAKFDETTGGIEGLVHDDSLLPVAGAQVGIGGLPNVPPVLSDEAGRFSFSLLPEGKYPIFVNKLGYEATAKQVAVTAGQIVSLDITITAIPIREGYYATTPITGLFGCGSSWRPALPAVNLYGVAACGVLSIVGPSDYDQFLVRVKASGPILEWTSAVFESEWTSNQLFGAGMSFSWEVNTCSNDNGATFAEPAGRSPLRVRYGASEFDETLAGILADSCSPPDCTEEVCTLQIRAFSEPDTFGSSSAADIGITFQQRFTHYFSEFYNMDSPEHFSALADA